MEIPTEIGQSIVLQDILRANFSNEELTEYGNSMLELNLPSKPQNTETEPLHSEAISLVGSLFDLHNIELFAIESNMARLNNLVFLNLASKTINHNYAGAPLGLQAFINSIELLSDFATDALQPTFCRFIKSKLEKQAI